MMTYKLTKSDEKKIAANARFVDDYQALESQRPADTKSKTFRAWSMKRRAAAAKIHKGDAAYYIGKGQGALDLAEDHAYAEKTDSKPFNMGYHDGFSNPSNLRDLIAHNENFAHLR